MDNHQKDLSYFKLRLQELLNTSFPEKANDHKFIEQRSSWAAQAYQEVFNAGNTLEQCSEMANYLLFQNLYFSKFDTVFQLVCNEFDSLMADEELSPFALKMLPVCESVFSSYNITDDFASSEEFDLLYTEIVGIIALWIQENGLQ
jgi:hypothetical protein